jgi:lysophospholipase L1-like esterase
MKKILSCLLFISILFVAFTAMGQVTSQVVVEPPQEQPANIPSQRPEPSCNRRHAAFNERAKMGDIDLMFFGDSITHGWDDSGKTVWQEYYGKRKAVNFGNSGDRTQNILWRLDHGNIDGVHPKLIVIMIGTNNLNDNPDDEIFDGIKGIVDRIRTKLPETKILLLAIFPREEKPGKLRAALTRVNSLIAKLGDGKQIVFFDIGQKFVLPDGTLSRDVMPDSVHLSEKGYQIWAEAIEPIVAEILGARSTR